MIGMRRRSRNLSTGASEGKPELVRLARRVEQADQRRQNSNAGCESDQHAESGDQAQFGHAAVIGGQERQEAGGGRARGQRQRRADIFAGLQDRALEVIEFMALGAIAHAVLDSEIDADADEQHRKVDRDQVKRADHQQAERRGQREPDEQVDEHGDDEPRRAQREPQDDEHDGDGDETVAHGAFLDGGEFLVRHRHRPGEPHVCLEFWGDLGRCLADRVGGDVAGLYRSYSRAPGALR